MTERDRALAILGERLVAAGLDQALWARSRALAEQLHADQWRNDGTSYLEHVVAVAAQVERWQLPPHMVLAGLLSHVTTTGGFRLRRAQRRLQDQPLGDLLAALHQSAQQIETISRTSKGSHLKQLFEQLAASSDAALIHCADALTTIRLMRDGSDPTAQELVHRCQEIFLPLLERLGMWDARGEMADQILRLRDSERFLALEQWRQQAWANPVTLDRVRRWQQELADALSSLSPEILVKPRLVSSIDRRQELSLLDGRTRERDDRHLYTTFILVETIDDAYRALRAVHQCGKPASGSIRDYFAEPRASGYAALHTNVIFHGIPLTVRILTHHLYALSREGILMPEARALRDDDVLPDHWPADQHFYLQTFISNLRRPIQEGLHLFTPAGDTVKLDAGATVLDFAYAVHTALGMKARNALVNGETVALNFQPHSGDVVEIVPDAERMHPDDRWLEWVNLARSQAIVQRQLRQRPEKRGRRILDEALRGRGRSLDDYLGRLADVAARSTMTTSELIRRIGQRTVRVESVVEQLLNARYQEVEQLTIQLAEAQRQRFPGWHSGLLQMASCCAPRPDHEVVARLTEEHRFEVHDATCEIARALPAQQRIPLVWASQIQPSRRVEIKLFARNRKGLIHDITLEIRDLQADISYLEGRRHGSEDTVLIRLEITNDLELYHLVNSLRKIRSVTGVTVDDEQAGAVSQRLAQSMRSSAPIPMLFAPGLPTRDPRFFAGRGRQFLAIEEFLNTPSNTHISSAFHLTGAKRIGKSSLLRVLGQRDFAATRLHYVFVDFQGLGERELAPALYYIARRIYRSTEKGSRVELPPPHFFDTDPVHAFSDYVGTQINRTAARGKKLTLALDEVGVLLEAYEKGILSHAFFDTVSHVFEEHDLHLIFCTSGEQQGSVVGRTSLRALFPNPLQLTLDHLPEEDARELLHRPLRGHLYYEPLALDELVRITAGHPHYLHILGANLITLMNEERRRTVTADDIQRLVQKRTVLTGEAFAQYFETDDELLLLRAIAAAAPCAEGATEEQIARTLHDAKVWLPDAHRRATLETLVKRASLAQHDLRYRIRVPLFAEWLDARRIRR